MAESGQSEEPEIDAYLRQDSEVSVADLSNLLWRVSANSERELDKLIGELQTLSEQLHGTSNRVEREIMEHAALGDSVRHLTKILADSVTQVKKAPDAASFSE